MVRLLRSKTVKGNDTFTFFRPITRNLRDSLYVFKDNVYYSWLVRKNKPKRNEKRKHHISLCIMFKDEAVYLREWLEYHLMVGVDHFYLYDNNSSDDFERVIGKYLDEGVATLIHWTKEHAQVEGYEDCIRRFQSESDWIGFIDVDEFLVPVEEESLVSFLDRFSNRASVLVYWRLFGSGGMLDRDTKRLVTEDFVVASEKLYSKGKCFFNSNFDYLFGSERNKSMFHYLWTVSEGKAIPPVDVFNHTSYRNWYPKRKKEKVPVQLNHYVLKSLEEHREKDKKGDVYYDHPTHDDGMFFLRDKRCTAPDYQIFKYVAQLKVRLKNLD